MLIKSLGSMPTKDVLKSATVTVVVSVSAMKLVVSAVLIATGQLPAPKSEITPVVASTVQIELAAVVANVSAS
jgi:hypothetical protein